VHFITGGAFNGKRAWVRKRYEGIPYTYWVSAYEDRLLPKEINHLEHELLILEGVEIWLQGLTEEFTANKCREIWNQCLENWLTWEKAEPNRTLVVIGTDITKGIVPIKTEYRIWRDVTGWAYQDIAAKSDKVEIIWYGLNQTIK
jgi:adenosylcobinamide kinase / adenosylcobinamide-phosphate guanylyltransferase